MSFIDNLMELGIREKVDRLYLEKCQEVNKLTEELRKLKEAQDGELISRTEALKAVEAAHSRVFAFTGTLDVNTMNEIMSQYGAVKDRALELIGATPAVSGLSAAERLHEEVEELWKDKSVAAESLADLALSAKQIGETIKRLWEDFNTPDVAEMAAEPLKEFEGVLEQTVTAQEILCLSSALRNLYEIHKCDGWLLYTKLAKVLERAVDEYSRELGDTE